MATFGKTSNGAGENQDGGGTVRGCKFTLSSGGRMTSMTMRSRNNAVGTVKLKMAIYADSSGSPGAFQLATVELSLTNTSDQENTANITPNMFLPAGDYWLVSTNDGGTGGGGIWFREDALSNGVDFVGNTYPTFPNPFGSPSNQNFNLTIYVTYTPTILQTFNDTVTMSDTLSKAITRKFTETAITLSDTFLASRVYFKTLSDTLTISDTIIKFLNGVNLIWKKQSKLSGTWAKLTRLAADWTKVGKQ